MKISEKKKAQLWQKAFGKPKEDLDQIWIEQAKQKWKTKTISDEKCFKKFLVSYLIHRNIPVDKRDDFINICHPIFRRKLPNTNKYDKFAIEVRKRWDMAVCKLSLKIPYRLHSATLKLYWLYHPEKLTMYDEYARLGLQYLARESNLICKKCKIIPENYLIIFYAYYDKIAKDYIQSNSQINHKYKYRILDKYLWHVGDELRKKAKKAKERASKG